MIKQFFIVEYTFLNFLYFCYFTDGQAIAKKICGQISRTTNAIKKLVKEYDRNIAEHHQSKFPASITFKEIADLNSSVCNHLEDVDADSQVPYYIRRKMIDFNHIIHRSAEEVELVKGEMFTDRLEV